MDAAYLKELATCEFVKQRKNIVMIGNPGTGKTHLSIALGIKACNLGMKVKLFTAANLANSLIEAQDNRALMRLEKQLSKADLLIIDELSYLTFANVKHFFTWVGKFFFTVITESCKKLLTMWL